MFRTLGWISRVLAWLSPPVPVPEHPNLPTPPKRPRRRGLTPEQREAARKRYAHEMKAFCSAISKHNRDRAVDAGLNHFTWRSVGDERVCSICAAHDGKQFSYSDRPEVGFPGEVNCCPQGYCRCQAEPVFKRS